MCVKKRRRVKTSSVRGTDELAKGSMGEPQVGGMVLARRRVGIKVVNGAIGVGRMISAFFCSSGGVFDSQLRMGGRSAKGAGLCRTEDFVRQRCTCLFTDRMLAASPLLLDSADEWMVLLTQRNSWLGESVSAICITVEHH